MHRLRKVAGAQRHTCGDTYQRLVVAAANALESVFASLRIYNPLRHACASCGRCKGVGGFQFLSCSSFPRKHTHGRGGASARPGLAYEATWRRNVCKSPGPAS